MYEEISELTPWVKAHDFVLKVYECSKEFPKEEAYSLTSQIRRAVVSIPSNIVEGRARESEKEYQQFLQNARGSLEETRYQLLLSKDLTYITLEKYQELEAQATEVSKMLIGLMKKLDQRPALSISQRPVSSIKQRPAIKV